MAYIQTPVRSNAHRASRTAHQYLALEDPEHRGPGHTVHASAADAFFGRHEQPSKIAAARNQPGPRVSKQYRHPPIPSGNDPVPAMVSMIPLRPAYLINFY